MNPTPQEEASEDSTKTMKKHYYYGDLRFFFCLLRSQSTIVEIMFLKQTYPEVANPANLSST